MTIRGRLFTAAIATAGIGALVLLPAQAASAAGVEVSHDGWTFGSSISDALYDDLGAIVPGDSLDDRFYLRNGGSQTGFLRVTVRETSVSNPMFGDALRISAATPGFPGVGAVALTDVQPCHVLVAGQTVSPGEIIPVTTTLALDDLNGSEGMGSTASLTIRVTLSQTQTSGLPATDCGGEGTDIPVLPSTPSGGNPGSTPSIGGTTGFAPIDTPEPERGFADRLPDRELSGSIVSLGTDPNTWRLFQEYAVAIFTGAFLLGGGGYALFAWLRRDKDSKNPSQEVTA